MAAAQVVGWQADKESGGMERFVFVTAVIGAAIAALAYVIASGAGTLTIESDHGDVSWGLAPIEEPAPERLEERVFAVRSIEFRDIAARIVVVPEAREDVALSIDNPGSAPTPRIEAARGRLVIDGKLSGRVDDCEDEGVSLRGYGEFGAPDLPLITLRTPLSVDLGISGAAFMSIGAADALALSSSGCGKIEADDVAGDAEISLSGSSSFYGEDIGALTLSSSGSSDFFLGAVRDGAEAHVSGSGDADIASISGDLELRISGSGNLLVRSGDINDAEIRLAGSGAFNALSVPVQQAEVRIAGSGEAHFGAAIQRLDVSIAGSGDVVVDGDVGDLDASVAGSGEVRVARVTGDMRQSIAGNGSIRVLQE